MEIVLVKYSEIGLKGRNRYIYEDMLVDNIKKSCRHQNVKLIKAIKGRNRVVCEFDDSQENIEKALSKVFGIKYFSFVQVIEKDVESLKLNAKKMLFELKQKNVKEVAFKTKRSDKRFELESPQINSLMGEIATDLEIKVNYKEAIDTIFVEITEKKIFMHNKRIYSLDGLPVGSTGKVLCLLSGGIDSPVAAYLTMSRGCQVDFIHFHTFDSNEQVLDSKILKMAKKLNDYQFESKLFTMPCQFYRALTCDQFSCTKIKFENYKLVVFKHFIFKMAQKVAQENGYQAIISGDSLAQVASQTIENMHATQFDIDSLILRPLVTYDKESIIKVAREIDTYELSIEPYKDCCSLMADNPQTKASIDVLKRILDEMNFAQVIEKSKNAVEVFEIK